MIEVSCECGRVHTVPEDREGKKLQCRRCGAVVLVRRGTGGPVVPFLAPVDSGDERPAALPRATARRPAPPPPDDEAIALDFRDPLRPCPVCGVEHELTITLCTRCGYDWKKGKRRESPAEVAGRETARRAINAAEEGVRRAERLSKLALVPPLGLALGPVILVASGSKLATLGGGTADRLRERLAAARLLAVFGLVVSLGIVGFIVLGILPSRGAEQRAVLSQQCLQNLGRIHDAIGAAVSEKGRFPARDGQTFREALELLVLAGKLEPSALRCPVVGGEAYRFDIDLPIDARTAQDRIVAWEADPHEDDSGKRAWRALHASGHLEKFTDAQALEKARARARVKDGVAGLRPQTPGVAPPRPTPGAGPAPATPGGWDDVKVRLITFATELDARDPELKSAVSAALVRERTGLAPGEVCGLASKRDDPASRRAAARVVARCELPARDAEQAAKDLRGTGEPDPEVELALARGLKRSGSDDWLGCAARAAVVGQGAHRDEALALVVEEAASGQTGLRHVLLELRELRRRGGVAQDRALLPLTSAAFPLAAELLGDLDVVGEAVATLASGGEAALESIDRAREDARPKVREAALRALRTNLAWRDAPLDLYFEKLAAEKDLLVRAGGLGPFELSPPPLAVLRALELLREPPRGQELMARRILERAAGQECFEQLVLELDRPGTREVAVLELRRPARVLDEELGLALVARVARLTTPGAREACVDLCADRWDERALHVVLERATDDKTASVRRRALFALQAIGARLPDNMRREAPPRLAARLPREDDPDSRDLLMKLVGGCEYRSAAGLRELEQLARRSSENQTTRTRAVEAIAMQPLPRAVTALVDLIDGLADAPRKAATRELRTLTGLNPGDSSAEWRRALGGVQAELKRRLKDREDAEARAHDDARSAADRKLHELRRLAGRS